MKVFEVITPPQQIQLDEVWYNPMTWFGTGDKASNAKQAASNAKALKAAQAAAAKVKGASPEVQKVLADIAKGATVQAKEAARTSLVAKIGNMAYILTILGAIAISVELYYNFSALEKKYNAGELNQQQYKEAHEAYWGLWVVQFMAPWLARTLGIAKLVTFLIRLIVGVMTLGVGFFSGGVAAGAAISGIVVEQAVFTAIQGFMMTKTFENWMAEHMFKPLVMLGSIPDESWNILRGYLSKLPGLNKIMSNPGSDFYTDKEKEKERINPAAAARDRQDAQNAENDSVFTDKNAIVINRTRVTDKDGNLDPNIMARPGIQAYISVNPNDPAVKKALALQSK